MTRHQRLTRRRLLALTGPAALALLAACAAPAAPTATPAPAKPAEAPKPAEPTKPAEAPKPTEAPKPAQAPAAAGAVAFSWWTFPVGFSSDYPHGKWEADAAKRYQDANAGTSIEVLPLGWEALEKLTTGIAAGSPPDLLGRAAWGYLYAAKKSGVLQEIELRKELMDDLPPGYYKASLYEGKNYMLPWYIMGTGARVNVTLAREAKVEEKLPKAPEYAWNWDQWLDFAKAVAALKNKDGKPVFGAILPTQTTVPAFHWTTFQWIWNMGGDMTKDGMGGGCAQLSSEAGVKALQFLQDLYYSQKVVPNPASIKFEDVGPYWDQSTLGYQTGIGLNNVRAKDVKGDKKTAILTAPQGHEWMLVRNPTAPGVTHQGWGGPSLDVNIAPFKQKESRKLEAIVDFGHFLVNKENQNFMAQFQVPARQSVAKEKLGDDPWVKMTLDNLVPGARGFPADDNSLKMRETFHNHYQELFIGGNPKKAKEVAADIDAEARRIVGC